MESLLPVLGQQIRVKVREGTGVPLVLCNGIGASLEVLDPLVERSASRYDGGPFRRAWHWWLAEFAAAVWVSVSWRPCLASCSRSLALNGKVDVLGLSWGGALAQQFAFQNPRRCRRLILVSTGTGALMVPGRPRVLAKMADPAPFLGPRVRRRDRG